MPFVTICGVTGKLYVPELTGCPPGKHPCPDCFSCQYCSDDRCNICRRSPPETHHYRREKRAVATVALTAAVHPAGK